MVQSIVNAPTAFKGQIGTYGNLATYQSKGVAGEDLDIGGLVCYDATVSNLCVKRFTADAIATIAGVVTFPKGKTQQRLTMGAPDYKMHEKDPVGVVAEGAIYLTAETPIAKSNNVILYFTLASGFSKISSTKAAGDIGFLAIVPDTIGAGYNGVVVIKQFNLTVEV